MGIIEWLKALFNKFVRIFKEMIKQAIPFAKQIVIGELRDIAVKIVSELESTDLSDEDKRNQAFERIRTYAISQGIEARDSLINFIVELAVQLYKEENSG